LVPRGHVQRLLVLQFRFIDISDLHFWLRLSNLSEPGGDLRGRLGARSVCCWMATRWPLTRSWSKAGLAAL